MERLARQLGFGLVAGALLSALRAPAGLDLVHLGVPDARVAALFRAAALFALVLPLDPARRAFRHGVRVLALGLGACAGFLAQGLFLAQRFEPQGRVGFVVWLVAGTLALFGLAGGRAAADPGDPGQAGETGEAGEQGPGRRERLGLVVVGIALAIACEHLARYARLFGVGLPEDDSVLAIVFLACTSLGALAFGPFVARRPAAAGGLGALAVAATLVGLRFADHLEADVGRDPLYNYLLRFGLDLTLVGTWRVTALLAAAFFVVPGFALGSTLVAARHARRLGALLTGAGLGTLFVPWIVDRLARACPDPELWTDAWAWTPWALATLCALVGAWIALTRAPGRGLSIASGLVALLALAFAPRVAVWPFSPWYLVPIEPLLAAPVAEGLLTVELERGGARVVTLDRKLLTPTAHKHDVDERRIRWSWGLLDAEARAANPRVLFVGQMTPTRAQVFDSLGAMRLERTVPWAGTSGGQRVADAVEEVLFADAHARPPGARVDPSLAAARIVAGEYALVIVAPVQGPLLRPKSAYALPWGVPAAPVLSGLEALVPEGTLAVAWVDAAAPLVSRTMPPRAILAAKHFDDLSIGFVLGTLVPAPLGEHAAVFATGQPRARESGWALLCERADGRSLALRAALAARLEHANAGTELEDLAQGLALHYAEQERSSPFEDYAAQIEISEDQLRAFARSAKRFLDPLSRAIWEDLALLLSQKRMIDMSLVYLEPLAQRYGPWPQLERAVAFAYSEFGMSEEALALLDGVLEREPYQIDLLLECARVAEEGGDLERALGYVDRALAIQADQLEARVRRALLSFDLGRPAGRRLLEELRAEGVEDDRIGERLDREEAPEPGG